MPCASNCCPARRTWCDFRSRPGSATLELLRGIAPDVREVLSLAEAFGIEPPVHDLRERADAATADYIAAQVPRDAPTRRPCWPGLSVRGQPAVASCRAAYDRRYRPPRRSNSCWRRRHRRVLDRRIAGASRGTDRARNDAVADGACTGGGGRGCGAGGRPGATWYGVGTAERRRRHGHADRCPARRGLSPCFTKCRRSMALW